MKHRWLPLLLAGLLCVGLLVGCGQDVVDTSAPSAPPATTSTVAEESADNTSDLAEPPAEDDPSSPDTPAAPSADSPAVTDPTVVRPTVTDPVVTTTTTTTTTTAADPNRAIVNGKTYAVGDTFRYTVMVKTAESYGTVKVGVRCLQKGLEVPSGTFQKQNQYVMQNLGIGRFGTLPEDTVGQNGFTMTVNKGYQLETATAGYAGFWWYYETKTYQEIDCSGGVALFTMELKITKPGEYLIEGAEYSATPRTDLTVWGVFA